METNARAPRKEEKEDEEQKVLGCTGGWNIASASRAVVSYDGIVASRRRKLLNNGVSRVPFRSNPLQSNSKANKPFHFHRKAKDAHHFTTT